MITHTMPQLSVAQVFLTFPLDKFPASPLGFIPVFDSNMTLTEACKVLAESKMCAFTIIVLPLKHAVWRRRCGT